MIWATVGRLKSKRWQRSTTVGSTLLASVVASTKIVCGGGSSSVLRNAFQACRREHVRLVEDVDLVAPGDRRVGDLLAQVADVVDRVVRRRVHLDHVERRRVRDRHARLADAARRDRRPVHRSSATPRGSSPSTSCPSRASRRTGTRGGPCPARSRWRACGPRAPAPRRPRTSAGGGGGRGWRRPEARAIESRGENGPCTLRRGRFLGRVRRWWLRSGYPAAPAGDRLRLLPSGSDLVHGPTSRGTRPSTPHTAR